MTSALTRGWPAKASAASSALSPGGRLLGRKRQDRDDGGREKGKAEGAGVSSSHYVVYLTDALG